MVKNSEQTSVSNVRVDECANNKQQSKKNPLVTVKSHLHNPILMFLGSRSFLHRCPKPTCDDYISLVTLRHSFVQRDFHLNNARNSKNMVVTSRLVRRLAESANSNLGVTRIDYRCDDE